MQRGLRVITLQWAIEKSSILLSQYLKNEWLDGTIIISYFSGSNNIFTDGKLKSGIVKQKTKGNVSINIALAYTVKTAFV